MRVEGGPGDGNFHGNLAEPGSLRVPERCACPEPRFSPGSSRRPWGTCDRRVAGGSLESTDCGPRSGKSPPPRASVSRLVRRGRRSKQTLTLCARRTQSEIDSFSLHWKC